MTRRLAFLTMLLALLLAPFVWRSSAAAPDAGWWDARWPYRVAIDIDAAGVARHDKVVDVAINFTPLLDAVGEEERFNPTSIRVLEVEGNTIIDEAVAFQFDRDSDYNPTTNAAGTLVILLTGPTAADQIRRYHVYFDVLGAEYDEPLFPERVALGNVTDAYGFTAFRIRNDQATYTYHKTGGGFSSLVDADERDWINWNTSPKGAGDFRGVPNMVHPNDGGYFHPGRNNVNSTLTRRGPLKATIRSSSPDGYWSTQWEIYPDSIRLTVLKAAVGKAYYLLYEGTPGGQLDLANDLVVRSDGTTTPASESWVADIPGEEWVYFADPTLGRSLYAVHHADDELIDSYAPDGTQMTVFGFGRNGNARLLTGTGRQMTIGLVDETGVTAVAAAIQAVTKPLLPSIGETQQRPATPTPSPSPTSPATDTPTPTLTPSATPTATPTQMPTATPTESPTWTPTATHTTTSTSTPAATATQKPTREPLPTPTREARAQLLLPIIAGR